MLIDEEELKRRLNSPSNLANSIPSSNSPTNSTETPTIKHESTKRTYEKGASQNQRVLAGILANSMPSTKVAQELNMTRNQVFHAARTSQEKVAGPRDKVIDRVQELALDKMMCALGLMTPDKFAKENLKDLAVITAQMSKVVGNTSEKNSNGPTVQLIVYSPEIKDEKSFNVIDV